MVGGEGERWYQLSVPSQRYQKPWALHLTCAVAVSSATTGTATTACSTICTAAITNTVAASTAVVGIIAAARTVVAGSLRIVRGSGWSCGRPGDPFVGSRPSATPESFSSSPFCACGYPSIACSYTP